ncbi:MAG: hypothetical protein AABX71_02800 [Nanoarchaeota archaeon]
MKRGTRVCIRNSILNFHSCKRSQIQISFGMIFSIILIIAFIGVAFYAINIFLDWKKCIETGMFKEDLQEAVDRAWSRDSSSEIFSGNLQASLERVCFVDLSKDKEGEWAEYYDKLKKEGYIDINIFFWPLSKVCEGQRSFSLKHLNMSYITENANPHCAESTNGKIELRIEKGFDDVLVKIS